MPRIVIKLDKLLKQNKTNQKEIAELVNTNRQRIGRLVHGQNSVPLDLLGKIAEALNVRDINQLIDFE